jgi:Uncharacterized protein conserved in bacteria (DUF2191).
MPTRLTFDARLVEQARRLGGHRTKREAVSAALVEYVQRRQQLAILELRGSVPYDEDYAHKPLRTRRWREAGAGPSRTRR